MTAIRDLVLAYYEAVDSGDLDRILGFFSPNAQYERGGYPPMYGARQLREFYRTVRIIESGTHRIDMLLVEESAAAAAGHFTGVSRAGSSLDIGFADFFTFDGALMKSRTTYFLTRGV